jgi:hypothetical protein
MKPNIVTSTVLVLFGFGAGQVMAQTCTDPLDGAALVSTLNGKYVCAKRSTNEDRWNEFHRGTGPGPFPIIDYKRGPGHPIDPSKVVGTYTISLTANTVTYDYGNNPPGPYTYTVKSLAPLTPGGPATYRFCNVASGEAITAIVSTSPTQSLCFSP